VESGEIGGARWCVSTRYTGGSAGEFAEANVAQHVGDDPRAVAANRRGLLAALSTSRDAAYIQAEHGAQVAWVDSSGEVANVDALITETPGLGIVALGADCAVVGLTGHRVDGTVVAAVVHCGWRGLAVDVIGSALDCLAAQSVQELTAVVGPAICGRCYQVSRERCADIESNCSSEVANAAITRSDSDTGAVIWGIDIAAGVRARLQQRGVKTIGDFGCTFEQDRWFSLRRSVERGGPQARTGRHALAMVVK